jgi:ubiquinone biosynthesis protein UbiJ
MLQALEQLVARDATLCAAMADEIRDYLKSSTLFWEPDRGRAGGAELPKLTVGGSLLAMRRLETLHGRLDPEQEQALARAREALALQKHEWGLRYQAKLARELRSRLDTWAWYLDDVKQQGERAIVHYPREVETRVKIELLMDEAAEVGLEVDEGRQRLTGLDERLGAQFIVGEFCWIEELAPGFPAERFWYLYGQPQPE